MLTDKPPAKPVTIPEEEPTVAILGALVVHIPPGAASVRVIFCPAQTEVGPLMAPKAPTLTTAVARQPDGSK